MANFKKLLGKKIKYYREKKGITQEKLAEKIDINSRSLSFIECGTNFVTADTLEKICKNLEVSPKQLFDFDFNPKSNQEIKDELNQLINTNPEKLNDIYNILKGFLG
ncbi:helix-turn-helix transcriptional regulator [bacterium]|nr:helix-turn-helix transcriptional regulator [bacterium]